VLGHSSRSPVPTAWLSPGAAQTEGAFRAYLGAMSEGDEVAESSSAVRGVPASPGVYEGRVRLVHGAAGIGDIRDGDILVSEATSPAFNLVLPLIGAIVTDQGGMLCHAAIVAREYGIPAVVGTDDATRRLPDGARVRVDGGRGEATVVDA
ncbi:MAG: PEP-utilizing protein mobile subunit, partial [Actinobacteria bacterium]|nr:PEP-utilizing protein mobile subunit [Actinomycetota bacterium]